MCKLVIVLVLLVVFYVHLANSAENYRALRIGSRDYGNFSYADSGVRRP